MYKQLTERLNQALKRKGVIVKFWERGDIKRLYISDSCLYQTKKCQQAAYIDLNTFILHVYTDCPSQTAKWCQNESESYLDYAYKYARLARLLYFHLKKTKGGA